ncbi:adenylate/guanylate cyclase domain-containing protein [Nocardioides guangzhouensis]|uniref:Adenylate/guanylate cyclase domain-containing protein n=1 Tax=Nocardioides guangzhouensis TaxID=2497878 RepID=A0A4V1XYJ9_9ACTN|nr:adenylate/guanylate cyclase domain-containing protein [Nocardioides guangzhouensis]RYP83509.1 adenylate/guanylate cyclase domain-containing protein [Nocardioides guangzhouensis]
MDDADEPELRLSPATFESIEETVLGRRPHLTRPDVLERTGVDRERAHALWLSLGFPAPADDDEVLFTDDDVEALRTLAGLMDAGLVDPGTEYALTRSMGRSFARLAEWEITEVAAALLSDGGDLDDAAVETLLEGALPAVERLQNYIWRRHLASAVGRLLATSGDGDAVPMAIGFADIVGFTRRSRGLSTDELAQMVETFEATATAVVADHGGRVIKTIGDEILYACDDPVEAARVALVLADGHRADEDFPQVRVGAAYGGVLRRLGDVFGEPVNIASRLTSLARPGRVLVDRPLADALRQHEDEFRLRRVRGVSVKGYTRLETWALRPARGEDRQDTAAEVLDALSDLLPLPRRTTTPG